MYYSNDKSQQRRHVAFSFETCYQPKSYGGKYEKWKRRKGIKRKKGKMANNRICKYTQKGLNNLFTASLDNVRPIQKYKYNIPIYISYTVYVYCISYIYIYTHGIYLNVGTRDTQLCL